jgi:hypothetical protein
MENIDIQAGARTPQISFNPSEGVFLLEGESYPEDTRKFYDEPLSKVHGFLGGRFEQPCTFAFKLKYFNSSSAKVLMDLFIAIEESAVSGNVVSVEWHCAEDDDNMQELGEEFSEELSQAKFSLITF